MRSPLICGLAFGLTMAALFAKERQVQTAKVNVQMGHPGCRVDLDGAPLGTTGTNGALILSGVDPGDHYIHVRCPGKPEAAYYIAPKPGEEAIIRPAPDPPSAAGGDAFIAQAQSKVELQKLVQQAVQLRAQARLDEAVAALHQAAKLDPGNSDLHRELGITFLLGKEWKPARVEMMEAIRYDQSDADAHNGLGYALEKLGDLDGAVKEYRTAMNLQPDDEEYRTHYYDALVKIQTRQLKPK
jgi:hypothetical protein